MPATFLHGHATHPDAQVALALAAAQVDAQFHAQADASERPNLGWVYITDHYADRAEALLADLRQRWPGVSWVGAVGVAISACGVEYVDEPALALMLAHLPQGSFVLFSGEHALQPDALDAGVHTAQVHADARTPELDEMIHELAARTHGGYLFGGLAASRTRTTQFCAPWPGEGGAGWAGGVYEGGVSGVGFGPHVDLVSRVTQGCQPIGPVRRVTAAQQNLILEIDGRPALPILLQDIGVDLDDPRRALPRLRATLVGLSDAADENLARAGQFGADTRVRHLVGLDPARQAVAIADRVEPGMRVAFCHRDVDAARRDLMRICAEIRDELSPGDDDLEDGRADAASGADAHRDRRIAGAIYVSCNGRGGAHFGGPSAELQIVRHALGEVPLVGFFAGGEIARHHLYGYTGVLTVFAAPA